MNNGMKTLLKNIKLVVFDFDGVFTDNRVFVSEDGKESVACCRSDNLGVKRLAEVGVKVHILSSEVNGVVTVRMEKLRIACQYAVRDKGSALEVLAKEYGVSLNAIAFLGNDINDADCLAKVGLPVVVNDAYDEVKPLAKIILSRKGGYGAVRELCDMIWRAQKEGL